jgi:hypothetical protein
MFCGFPRENPMFSAIPATLDELAALLDRATSVGEVFGVDVEDR